MKLEASMSKARRLWRSLSVPRRPGPSANLSSRGRAGDEAAATICSPRRSRSARRPIHRQRVCRNADADEQFKALDDFSRTCPRLSVRRAPADGSRWSPCLRPLRRSEETPHGLATVQRRLTLSELWFGLQRRSGPAEGVEIDDELRARVRASSRGLRHRLPHVARGRRQVRPAQATSRRLRAD